MQLTHLGHACFIVDTGAARLLFDPGCYSDVEGVTGLDAVLITHQHEDHVDTSRLAGLLASNPQARLVVDPDTASSVEGLPPGVDVARPGDVLRFGDENGHGGTRVDVLGGIHAAVYREVPGCTNNAYLVDGGALLHPGDSFTVPEAPVDVLLVAIDSPWLKLAEAVDYVRAVGPRVAVPMHESGASNPAKYAGMLAGFCPEAEVRRLAVGEPAEV
ncbi:MBL fold metallo-hydrolase [Demequina pelophila]|uniref:MBL fold metallo-hydrolase n=1 Tax=Demequina pelophila TaxID=1638984 RepID=UPI0007846E71|nr:MBL fold metallo-hydrolase [Demequina pelophila]